jgi:AGZA family xanthine/uracil permease-like MFS transporter
MPGLLQFTSDPGKHTIFKDGTVVADASAVPALVTLNKPIIILALIGLALTVILLLLKVRGAILIGIIATTIIGIPMGIVNTSSIGVTTGIGKSFSQLGITFGAAFGSKGMGSLFADAAKIPLVLMTIFAFSLSDTFDTIGTFIGTGRKSGIFSEEDMKSMENNSGFKSKMDKALFADAICNLHRCNIRYFQYDYLC